MKQFKYKSIKFPPEKWQEIKDLSDELSDERGRDEPLPGVVLEAVKFYKDHRNDPNLSTITSGGNHVQ